jgi:integrase
VASIEPEHVDALHRKITERGATYTANRVLAVVSKMFSLAIRWRMRTDNPCKGIERNQEHKRRRYLSPAELERLTKALAEHRDQQAANMIRLLLLTGARRGELQAMKWADVDIDTGTWTKPGATTKTKTDHQVPLSAPAKQLLAGVKRGTSEYVFPHNGSHRTEIKDNWAAVCKAAGITGARIHDCRHTYASILASAGQSLPIIGALLGHTQPSTTARYAHFFDDPLRAATERVGAIVTDQPTAEVVPLRRRRKVAK